jgi:hypothetical protein
MTEQAGVDSSVVESQPTTVPNPDRSENRLSYATLNTAILVSSVIGIFALSMWGGLVLIKLFRLPVPHVDIGGVAFAEVRTEVPPPPAPQILWPLHSVLFANGSRSISLEQRNLLAAFAKGLKDCAGIRTVTVIGSASSARYAGDVSDTRNATLARLRGEAVAAYLRSREVSIVDSEEGRRARRFDDVRTNVSSPRAAEALNRRADVIVVRDDCSQK